MATPPGSKTNSTNLDRSGNRISIYKSDKPKFEENADNRGHDSSLSFPHGSSIILPVGRAALVQWKSVSVENINGPRKAARSHLRGHDAAGWPHTAPKHT